MNKKKRRVAVLLSATIGSAVLVLSGCSGKSDQTEKTLRVGVINYTQDDPFINGLTDELKEQLKAMENKERRIIVSTKSGNDDQQEQNEKVEEMIDAGCDVLCINLVDRTAPSRIIRMARNEDIPVIFFNREPVREDLMQWKSCIMWAAMQNSPGLCRGRSQQNTSTAIRKSIKTRTERSNMCFWKEKRAIRMPSAEQNIP